ncbi:MAG: hypothetical protein IKN65_00120 [Clostridia bacterium]|nr:hypothetical protein [Bacilli bacterium]MBR3672688.1 hypothetical protein [Clostridia bacterium]MBR4671615.1 hypothetical protein [Bacilli bacterium]
MAYNKRINDEDLPGNYVDGSVLLHTDMNKLETLTREGINDNYEDIQKLQDGTFVIGYAATAGSAETSSALDSATLSTYDEETLQNNDAKVPTSKQVKEYVDAAVSGIVTDYPDLTNKPQINGVTLVGNKTSSDLGIDVPIYYYDGQNNATNVAMFNELCDKFDDGEKFLLVGKVQLQNGYTYNGTFYDRKIEVLVPISVKDFTDYEEEGTTYYSFMTDPVRTTSGYAVGGVKLTGTWGNFTACEEMTFSYDEGPAKKGDLATVALSGSYNDLSDKPTIAQSDWSQNSTIAADYIKNKPAIRTGTGSNSIVEGSISSNTASGNYSHAEGQDTEASGNYSHAEGLYTEASSSTSHAEGSSSGASAYASHAEGSTTLASGVNSHSEGCNTIASNEEAHAEGYGTTASGKHTHSEGYRTKASSDNQHAQGKYNIEDINTTYAHIVGNGTADNARSNAHTLDWSGNAWFEGDVYVGSTSGTNKDAGSKKLITADALPTRTSDLINDGDNRYANHPFIKNIGRQPGDTGTYILDGIGQQGDDHLTFVTSSGQYAEYMTIANTLDVTAQETIPQALPYYLGKVYQYTGATNANYTHGYFYQCVSDGASTPTYSWERIDVQPNSGGTVTDVQVDGTSIISSGVANLVTNTAYNASTNKIATMSDLPTKTSDLTNDGNGTKPFLYCGSNEIDTISVYGGGSAYYKNLSYVYHGVYGDETKVVANYDDVPHAPNVVILTETEYNNLSSYADNTEYHIIEG